MLLLLKPFKNILKQNRNKKNIYTQLYNTLDHLMIETEKIVYVNYVLTQTPDKAEFFPWNMAWVDIMGKNMCIMKDALLSPG